MRPKRERVKAARAETWLHLAVTAQRWADDITGHDGVKPFEEWPDDDPHRVMCRTYDLTPADLVRLLADVAQSCEDRALRLGYGENGFD